MVHSKSTPLYKRGWVWRLAIYLFLLLVTLKPQQEADTGEPSGIAGVMIIVALAEAIAYFFRRRKSKEQAAAERRRQAKEALNARVEALESEGIRPVRTSKAILRDGEQAFFAEHGTLHEMKSVAVQHAGVSARIRVAKGVSVGVGGGRSAPETQLVELSEGELVATDRRVIFAGRSKSFEAPISKVINVEYYANAVLINLASREKPYVVKLPPQEVVVFEETFRQILSR